MTAAERLLIKIEDLQQKVADAKLSAVKEYGFDRTRSDLQMRQQELLALKQRLHHAPREPAHSPGGGSPAEILEPRLGSALAGSFTGSDSVFFLEPMLNKRTDSY